MVVIAYAGQFAGVWIGRHCSDCCKELIGNERLWRSVEVMVRSVENGKE